MNATRAVVGVALAAGTLLAAVAAPPAPPLPPPIAGRPKAQRLAQAEAMAVYANPDYTLSYVGDGNPAHRLDLYLPAGPGPHPLVLYIHGGAWQFGDKGMAGGSPQGYDTFRSVLTSNGYAVASVNYRFSQEATFPAQLNDVRDAVRYLRAHAGEFGLDSNRFVAAGDSAGGELALLLGLSRPRPSGRLSLQLEQSASVRAVVSYYGVTDLVGIYADRADAGCPPPAPTRARTAEGALVAGDPLQGDAHQRAIDGSPVTHAARGSVPVLMFHGSRDCLVPLAQAQRLQTALQATGSVVELKVIPAGHAWPVFFRDPALQADLLDFLSRYDA